MKRVHTQVLHWYKKNGRSLPWRKTTSPYRVLVSEIMLQQTQVGRVVDFYHQWLRRFPTISALARASKPEVLRQWSGLGYNNRAVRLHRLAQIIVDQYGGRLPSSLEELQRLPGIGKYTSHAISCFAFRKAMPVVDVNIRRIITRMMKRVRNSSEIKMDREVWNSAKQLLPAGDAYNWNQALMDIGSEICTARNPHCIQCPLRGACRSAFSDAFQRKFVLRKRNEPSFDGVPRRLIRGKILKALHAEPLEFSRLSAIVSHGKDKRFEQFLRLTISQMELDGLVTQLGRGKHIRVAIAV